MRCSNTWPPLHHACSSELDATLRLNAHAYCVAKHVYTVPLMYASAKPKVNSYVQHPSTFVSTVNSQSSNIFILSSWNKVNKFNMLTAAKIATNCLRGSSSCVKQISQQRHFSSILRSVSRVWDLGCVTSVVHVSQISWLGWECECERQLQCQRNYHGLCLRICRESFPCQLVTTATTVTTSAI